MKLLKTAFRFAPIFSKNLLTSKVGTNKFVLPALVATSYAFMFATQKVLNQELLTIETDDNLAEGQMKQIQVGPKIQDTVIVCKYEGEIYCFQSKCAHFGVPLAKGLIFGDKVVCPAHNAGFSIKTGQPDQGPVFGGLKTFPVQKKDGKIIVSVPKVGWDSSPQRKALGQENVDKSKRIVIIGAGPSAQSAVDTLRDNGYKGQIYMISKENVLPYDRTLLSKMMNGSSKPGPIRSEQHNKKDGVVFVGESTVTNIDYDQKKVIIDSKESVKYDKLLIASGCVNRYPPISGLDKVNFKSLRNIKDYEQINQQIRKDGVKNITIIGGGFIGMQVASAIKLTLKDAVNVTVIEREETPLTHVLGKDVGKVLQELATKNGVNVITSANIKQIKSNNRNPESIVLDNQDVKTDVLLMSTGVKCAIDFASELVDPETHGIKTNVYLETNKKDVYASGDVASYPFWYTGKTARIEHYNEAIYQGSVAAMNMAGKKFPMDNIPFFWTRQFNNSLSFTGYTQGWDDIHITGDLSEMKFVAYYIDKKTDRVLGAASMGMMNQVQIINEAMRNGAMPKASLIKSGKVDLNKVLEETRAKKPKCSRCAHLS